MADALNDDWWVKEDIDNDQLSSNSDDDSKDDGHISKEKRRNKENDLVVKSEDKKTKKKEAKKKEKRKIEEKPDDQNDESDVIPTKKSKKRKKKYNDMDDCQATVEALWKFFRSDLEKTLSDIEMEDLKPENDDWFLKEVNPVLKDKSENFPLYLKNVIPRWQKRCAMRSEKQFKASPIMLILTSSAQRAVDLLRHTSSFKGEHCKTVKLFAKHFKVEDQMKFLKENVVHLAVGTPHRVATLIEKGSLKIKRVKYVIIDWTWKDLKMRRIFNMPDVKDDFLLLFQKHILAQCKKGTLSIGLF